MLSYNLIYKFYGTNYDYNYKNNYHPDPWYSKLTSPKYRYEFYYTYFYWLMDNHFNEKFDKDKLDLNMYPSPLEIYANYSELTNIEKKIEKLLDLGFKIKMPCHYANPLLIFINNILLFTNVNEVEKERLNNVVIPRAIELFYKNNIKVGSIPDLNYLDGHSGNRCRKIIVPIIDYLFKTDEKEAINFICKLIFNLSQFITIEFLVSILPEQKSKDQLTLLPILESIVFIHKQYEIGIVKYLINEVLKKNISINNIGEKGENILLLAANKKHLDLVVFLIEECNADWSVICQGNTVFSIACKNEDLKLLKYLVSNNYFDPEYKLNLEYYNKYIKINFGEIIYENSIKKKEIKKFVDKDELCSICLEVLVKPIFFDCGHGLHFECMKKYDKNKCTLCNI